MRKIVSLFLLIIFVFNTMGYFIAFKTMQYEIKEEIAEKIQQGIAPSKLTAISFQKSNLQAIEWFDDGKEIKYNNEFYDVVNSDETNNSITFYCINDDEENELYTTLEDQINKNVSANTTNKNDTSKKITDNVVKLFFLDEKEFLIAEILTASKFLPINLIYQHPQLETNSPPPEFV